MTEPNAPYPDPLWQRAMGHDPLLCERSKAGPNWYRRFWWLGIGLIATLAARAVIDGVRLIRAIMRGLV